MEDDENYVDPHPGLEKERADFEGWWEVFSIDHYLANQIDIELLKESHWMAFVMGHAYALNKYEPPPEEEGGYEGEIEGEEDYADIDDEDLSDPESNWPPQPF